MPRKKKEVTEETTQKQKGKKKKEETATKVKNFYCVVDKKYSNTKKGEDPLRFINIKVEEHSSKPGNDTSVYAHATIHYSWFNEPDEARQFKKDLLQEVI